MMGHRDKLISADEYDIIGNPYQRRLKYRYTDRPGVTREIKQRINRRARRAAKLESRIKEEE